jgi:serine/threonine protein kinase/tetratricopeptide (TPR) repeat protein
VTTHGDPAPESDRHRPKPHGGATMDAGADATLDAAPAGAVIPASLGSIGRYRLLLKLGEGGMGQVWLAEQTAPVVRRVALKLIKAGRYDTSALQRFDLERQSLAIMDHPAIAKVLDADSTAEGQPYFVMEYVPGLPITTYCDQKRLTTRQRLALFIKVCEGVQHAHQKAIIHRDLKPSNVLVVEVDGKPLPRIIDFGIAKAISHQSTDETNVTRLGSTPGTPGYMSPEQTDPSVLDVDTRTDVYSLGVILYQLLTGSMPFDPKQWRSKPFHEILRQLREDDPPSPSAKLSNDHRTLTATAENRQTGPKELVSLLRGDLDWIVLKALERDRSRRYGTPSELAADISHYLKNEPVVARPASAAYRLAKYVRRHRIAVTAAAGLALLLAGFGVTEFLQVQRVSRERDRANRITDFMVGMFKVSDPNEARGNAVTAREILDRAAHDINTGLARDPEVQSDLMYTMAETYVNLGLFSRAHAISEGVLENRRRLLGPENPKTLESQTQLVWILDREGRDAEAEKLVRATLATERRVLGPENPITLEAMGHLATILENRGNYQEEEKLQRELLEIETRKSGPDNPLTIRAMANLATAVSLEGRLAEAEGMYRKVLAVEQRVLGPDHTQTMATMHNLANRLDEQGRYVEAEDLYRQVFAIELRVLGPEHPDTLDTMTALANDLHYGESRTADAEALYRKALEIELRTLGPEHPSTIRTQEGLANVLSTEGHYAEAEKMHREILSVRLHTLGPDHTDTLLSKYNLASVVAQLHRWPEAEKLFRETLADQTRVLGAENADTMASQASLADVLVREGRYQEGETLARRTFETQLRVLGPQQDDTINTLQVLGTALVHNHRYAEAKKLFGDTIDHISQISGASVFQAWYNFACVAAVAHDRDEAIHHLREAIAHGYKDIDHMRIDEDLKSLHGDPRFEALLRVGQGTAANH